ncbi:DUF4271 domain-containing protein [Pseudocnuella soli]|uniref:DUF4271 domain-containing protein n=1 Tax=Pseudocnuella soli TaxID=2502779 RepID=UPI0010431F1C|nr:DUF4271 domain-containing protein [Pseudocnuella soli]
MAGLAGWTQAGTDSAVVPAPRPVDSAALARAAAAQARIDSVRNAFVQDSLQQVRRRDSVRQNELQAFMRQVHSGRYNQHPYLRFTGAERRISEVKQWQGKEGLFYGIVALILIFGVLRNAFPRYLSDLFRTYFRTTIRQRLNKEQVANAPLPSLLFNVLFFLSGAMLSALLLQHFRLGVSIPFWQLFLYCLAALAGIYLVKFIVLKLFGWLLRAAAATNTYIFVVFTTNKIMGILLLPLILGLAFTGGNLFETFLAICLAVVGGLFLYRYYLSFVSVHRLLRINLFHFLLYLAALEIVPLLLINKLMVQFFAQTP